LWFSQNKSRLREVRERINLMDSGFAAGPSLDLPSWLELGSNDYSIFVPSYCGAKIAVISIC
jgi:hypothetical protein